MKNSLISYKGSFVSGRVFVNLLVPFLQISYCSIDCGIILYLVEPDRRCIMKDGYQVVDPAPGFIPVLIAQIRSDVSKVTVNEIRKICVTRGDMAEFVLRINDKDSFLVRLLFVIQRKGSKIHIPVHVEEQPQPGIIFLFKFFCDGSKPEWKVSGIFLYKDRFYF